MARNEGAHSINPEGRGNTRPTVDLRDDRPEVIHREHATPRLDRTEEQRVHTKPAKTSAAAVFALVFGLSALLSVLTIILAPLGLILGLIAIVLGIVGMKMAKRVGVTGKGVAIAGLVLGVLAVLLAATAAIGVTTFLNDDRAVNQLEQRVEQLRENLPSNVDVPQP